MMDKPWLAHYPAGVPAEIDYSEYRSLVHLIDEAFQKHRSRKAYVCMDKSVTFGDVDDMSRSFAAWLQAKGLPKGARVAIMMPNCLQYPVALAGILRAGYVVVNVNPLYTPRELEHQLNDSGAEAIVIVENFASTLQQVIARTAVKHVVVAALGDLLGSVKGALVNFVVRKVKKMVPAWELPHVTRFNTMLQEGSRLTFKPVDLHQDDIAFLQYTGGTTGVSKGATLLHRNIIANVLQSEAWYTPALSKLKPGEQLITVTALPLYHIFALTVCCMLGMRMGGLSLLITNPRDIPAVVKDLAKHKPHSFPAVNTLFAALMNNAEFQKLDFSSLFLTVGGGMAVQRGVAERWLAMTGCPICEGYGLSETSPSATCNPTDSHAYTGTIGMPLPSTEVTLRDDEGRATPMGQPGEICLRGPQVMAGYWKRPDETAKVMFSDGFFRTGDIGVMDERGYVTIVDRKKDMILVSGFNVYPNEVEQVIAMHPGVLEVAAIGVPDEYSGEAVKVFVVKRDEALTEQDIADFCKEQLTGYKKPKFIEFRAELPKTNVGKILRRELRDAELKQAGEGMRKAA